MIKTLEKSGRTEDDAISAALKELGLDRDDVSVEIIERAKSGFLGIGASPAKVRVSYEAPDEAPAAKAAEPEAKPAAPVSAAPAPAAAAAPADEPADYAAVRAFLTGLLDRMGVKADLEIGPRENGGINVNISGSDTHLHISVDAENYRSKREESLTKLAEKMAEKAIKYKRSMALEPMNSYERHVIHTALQNYEGVTTSSTGVEPNRRVVVSYVRGEDGDRRDSRRIDRRSSSSPAPASAKPAETPASSAGSASSGSRRAANGPDAQRADLMI